MRWYHTIKGSSDYPLSVNLLTVNELVTQEITLDKGTTTIVHPLPYVCLLLHRWTEPMVCVCVCMYMSLVCVRVCVPVSIPGPCCCVAGRSPSQCSFSLSGWSQTCCILFSAWRPASERCQLQSASLQTSCQPCGAAESGC